MYLNLVFLAINKTSLIDHKLSKMINVLVLRDFMTQDIIYLVLNVIFLALLVMMV